ncbi:MAG: hypothetical protein M1820_000716 [Bogoriella megaspora]|nr:MAG: hypothetical protein M1820_000716 [Bogoriella megaspora]
MADSVSFFKEIENGRRSDRLVYRAIEDNEEDRTFLQNAILSDPLTYALAYPEAFKPQPKQYSTNEIARHNARNRLLAVTICLPGSSRELLSEDDRKKLETMEKEKSSDSKAPEPPELFPIGMLNLRNDDPATQHHRNAGLGMVISKPYQGKGYGSEALNWTIDWAFKFGGLHRVTVHCYSFNTKALKMYERLGFVKEGSQREAAWFNRGWHDILVYGFLESDWERLRGLD